MEANADNAFYASAALLGGSAKTAERIDAESAAGMDRQSDSTRDFRFHFRCCHDFFKL